MVLSRHLYDMVKSELSLDRFGQQCGVDILEADFPVSLLISADVGEKYSWKTCFNCSGAN